MSNAIWLALAFHFLVFTPIALLVGYGMHKRGELGDSDKPFW